MGRPVKDRPERERLPVGLHGHVLQLLHRRLYRVRVGVPHGVLRLRVGVPHGVLRLRVGVPHRVLRVRVRVPQQLLRLWVGLSHGVLRQLLRRLFRVRVGL